MKNPKRLEKKAAQWVEQFTGFRINFSATALHKGDVGPTCFRFQHPEVFRRAGGILQLQFNSVFGQYFPV
jgi:hypothetical protein